MVKKDKLAELRTATESLGLVSIVLRNVSSQMSDNMPWEWRKIREKGAELQFLNAPISCEDGVANKSSNGQNSHALVYKHQFGVRLIAKKKKKSEEPNVLMTIEAEYNAVYEHLPDKEKLSDTAVQEFGLHNVPFNLWPFWRELVHSTAQKMGVTELVLPLSVPQKR